MSDKIKINSVTGDKDKDDLKNCYFQSNGVTGQYNFYDTNNNLITTNPVNLTTGTSFSFTLDGHDWTVSSFVISDTAANGNWSNNDNPDAAQDGTFQAQAGGGVDPEEQASAAKM